MPRVKFVQTSMLPMFSFTMSSDFSTSRTPLALRNVGLFEYAEHMLLVETHNLLQICITFSPLMIFKLLKPLLLGSLQIFMKLRQQAEDFLLVAA